ncbi:MAG TPA: IclR family transcriptional regulator [Chloroflexota bacterium]|nr:IclR family transcriptional regulator [Chloroflexota bacterium]
MATSRAATRVDYTIGVLGKAMDLLDVLAAHEVLSLTELSKRAGVHKVTAFRILTNFEERGYVEREPATGHYRLGFRLMELGMRVTERLDLRTVARPILTALRAEVGETVNLAVPGSNGIVYIDILQSTYELRMAARVGAQDDYHATALGKAMIAFWPASGVAQLLRRGRLRAKTARTITTAKALQRELELTRERGYSVDDEENEVGARCIGAPVFDQSGAVVAAISVAGPVSRLAAETLPALAERVLQAGRQISHRLGYRDSGSDE